MILLDVSTFSEIKQQWFNEYGEIKTITFFVYGPFNEKNMMVINYALQDLLEVEEFAQTSEVIDWETAELYDIQQGLCLQWIFPPTFELEQVAKCLISDGLDYQRIKHEFYGEFDNVHERTT